VNVLTAQPQVYAVNVLTAQPQVYAVMGDDPPIIEI